MFGGAKKAKNDSSSSLQRFLDIRRDPASRFKHLRCVMESMTESSERRTFVEHHSFETYHLFHEFMCQSESLSSQHPGPRLAVQELECAFWLLEAIFCYLPEFVAQRWQYNGIALAMKHLLHPQNFLGVRRFAVRLFLQWYQILGVGPYGNQELDPYFSSLVPFLCSGNDGQTTEKQLAELCEQSYVRNALVRRPTAPDMTMIGSSNYFTKKPGPFATPQSVDKSIPDAQNTTKNQMAQSFMEKILEYISADVTKIQWSGNRFDIQKRCLRLLLEKLRRYYVSVCVTDPSSVQFDVYHPKLPSTNSGHSNATNGTLAFPTAAVDDPLTACRHALIRWVAVYSFSHKKTPDSLNNTNMGVDGSFGAGKDGIPQSPSPRTSDAKMPPNFELIRDCLFGSKPMVNFVFAMFRESFLLPLSYASTMGRVFKTLREWLLTEERPPFFNEPTSASTNTSEPNVGLQSAYMSIIYVLSSFFKNPYLYKDEDRATLLVQISAKILALFKYMACNSCQLSQETWHYLLKSLLDVVSRNVPSSPPVNLDHAQPTLIQRLAGYLFQTLLIAWVYAGLYSCVSGEMWDELLETLSSRNTWPELISEWGKVMESVTRALGVGVYGVDILDLPLERLSEQKMIKRQGASRGQVPECNDVQKRLTINAVNTNGQGDGGLNVAKPMYDFVQGSPMSNGPSPQQMQNSSAGHAVHRRSDVSMAAGMGGGTVRSKTSLAPSLSVRHSIAAGEFSSQLLSPDESSLDGSNSMDSSGPGVSSNSGEKCGEVSGGSLFENELLATTATPAEDADDSVSEEFVMAEESRAIGDDAETDNVDDESVVAACGPATVYVVWRRILGCLGDINQLPKPDLHLACVQLLEQLTTNLVKIKENQQVDVANQQRITPPPIVPQQTIMVTWLFNTLRLSERYHESKIIAMRLLCRIIVNQHRCAPSLDPALVAQFFALLHDSLVNGVEEITAAIISECGVNLFAHAGLSGGNLLIMCDFIRGASLLLSSDSSPKYDRIAAARFLSSIVCVANSLIDQCPYVGNDWNLTKVQGGAIQKEIMQLLRQLAKSNVEREIKVEGVKGVGLFLADQMNFSRHIQEHDAEECMQILLEILPFAGADVGLLVCNILQPLRELLPAQQMPVLTWRVVEWLLMALEFTLRDLANAKVNQNDSIQHGQYAIRLALDLIDWCIFLPLEKSTESTSPANVVWRLVELCYSCLSRNGGQQFQRIANTVAGLLLTFLYSKFDQGGNTQSYVKENFDVAIDQPNSGHESVVLSLRKNALLSLQQRQQISRLLFRQSGGRRCWNVTSVKICMAKESGTVEKNRLRSFDVWLSSMLSSKRIDQGPSQDKKSSNSNTGLRDAKDSLDRLMRHLNTTSPECFASTTRMDQAVSDYCFGTVVNEEAVATAISQMNLKPKTPSLNQASIRPTLTKLLGDGFTGSKFLLGSSGLLDWESHHRMNIVAFDSKSERLHRELKHLDGLLLTEAHKIAVLYVGDGQEDKHSILANRHGSGAFEDFVAALGWEVDLKTHCGYAGGLSADVHSTTTYYATATTETVFHISTRLPNDDPTKNLRHLGNDEVHIVWSEHWRDYRRSIIATEFCDVLIVIYPLEKIPFYKIRIEKRPEIGEFGPLADGMIVPWPILASSVRCTAINASRAKRMSTANYKNFYEHRVDSLKQAVEKLQAHSSYSHLLTSILRTGEQMQSHKPLVRSS